MNTLFLLMAEFETAQVPLDIIAKKFLGLDRSRAYTLANGNNLPFPVVRAGSSKSPWMVDLRDFAEWWDQERDAAKRIAQGAAHGH